MVNMLKIFDVLFKEEFKELSMFLDVCVFLIVVGNLVLIVGVFVMVIVWFNFLIILFVIFILGGW